jgi:cytochrome c oxidase assembly factor CtaG
VLLLLVVPALAALGRPAALLRTASNHPERVDRLLTSRVFRLFGNAVVAPLVPLVLFLLFLTPIAGALRTTPVGEAAITALVPLIGLLLAVALLEETGSRSGTFFVAEFLLGFVLLIADALPGILLRLAAGVVDGVHGQALQAAWVPSPLRDQQLAGDLLWFFAEVGDLPALILLIARWSRSDRREARSFDDLSDEEYTALVTAHLHGPDRPR